jgi:gamma-glutamylcyclotransferase
MLYFAYGSNMDWDEMHACCPSALFSFTARLDDYKLAFTRRSSRRKCGVADVLSAPGCCVWGVVYDISAPRDKDSLNRKEGYRPGRAKNAYAPLLVMIRPHGGEELLGAETYSVCCKVTANSKPSAQYKALLVEGAKHWQLPADYIQQLAKLEVQP